MSHAAATTRSDGNATPALPVDAATETSLQALIAALAARLGLLGQADSYGSVSVVEGDSGQFDAFGRKRVSLPHAESEVSFQYDLNPVYVETVVTKSATVTFNSSSRTAVLTLSTSGPAAGVGTVTIPLGSGNPKTATFTNSQTFAAGDVFEVNGTPYHVIAGATSLTHAVNGTGTAAAGSSFTVWGSHAVLRQRQRNLYQKGMSQFVKETFILPAAVEGILFQVGYYAHHNGYYARRKRIGGVTTVSFVERTFTTGTFVETEVTQANWNKDTFDGTGPNATNPSGILLDMTKGQILALDGAFLGTGNVRMGFMIGRTFYVGHEWKHANESTVAPYMQYFTLTCCYEAYNLAGGSVGGIAGSAICFSVDSEGGTSKPPQFYNFSAVNDVSLATSTGARAHLISIRPKQTFNGSLNNMIISADDIVCMIGNQPVLVEVFYGSTITGGAWVSADANSAVEYNITAALGAVGTRAQVFFAGTAGTTRSTLPESGINATYPVVLDFFGANPIAMTVSMTAIAGTPDCRAGINWQEWR